MDLFDLRPLDLLKDLQLQEERWNQFGWCFIYLIGQVIRQIVWIWTVLITRQFDVTMAKEGHIGWGAGDQEVGANVKLPPLKEQGLVNISEQNTRASQWMIQISTSSWRLLSNYQLLLLNFHSINVQMWWCKNYSRQSNLPPTACIISGFIVSVHFSSRVDCSVQQLPSVEKVTMSILGLKAG